MDRPAIKPYRPRADNTDREARSQGEHSNFRLLIVKMDRILNCNRQEAHTTFIPKNARKYSIFGAQ